MVLIFASRWLASTTMWVSAFKERDPMPYGQIFIIIHDFYHLPVSPSSFPMRPAVPTPPAMAVR